MLGSDFLGGLPTVAQDIPRGPGFLALQFNLTTSIRSACLLTERMFERRCSLCGSIKGATPKRPNETIKPIISTPAERNLRDGDRIGRHLGNNGLL